MNLILLSGNSLKNKAWIEEVEASLKPHFDQTHIQYYKHWESEDADAFIDLDYEISVLENFAENFGEYMIFAKSAGSWVTLKALHEKKINPTKLIFTGFAYNYAKNNDFPIDTWMKDLDIPSLYIQKELDPAVPFEKLTQVIKENNVQHAHLIEIEGDTHHYENIEQLRTEVEKFVL